ncbi:MAG: hypothetical protein HUU20_22440, partial [Pirellulales bacterium]|nr:hypothetical protein [Pirellulales bacterium]
MRFCDMGRAGRRSALGGALLLILSAALGGCGRLADVFQPLAAHSTRVKFRLASPGLSPLVNLDGGVMVYAINTAVTRGGGAGLEDNYDDTTMDLLNDNYKFWAVGWTGPNTMEGQAYCGVGWGGNPVELHGGTVEVTIEMSVARCAFGSDSFFGADDHSNGGSNFDLLTTQIATNTSPVFGGFTANSSYDSVGGSFLVIMEGWRYYDGVEHETEEGLVSACFSGMTSGLKTTSLALPSGLNAS